jgi:single-strand DNA-binding protein
MSELGVNKVVLVGRAGGNAELKFTAGGRPVASFSLAVNESFKRATVRRMTKWSGSGGWNKLAEIVGQYVTTGKLLFIEGRLQTRKYDDREGNARKVVEVVVSQLRLLASGSGNGTGNGGRKDGAMSHQQSGAAAQDGAPLDSDILF